jgi:uncharacterized circularly permuted ATP-grasp superfamily protein
MPQGKYSTHLLVLSLLTALLALATPLLAHSDVEADAGSAPYDEVKDTSGSVRPRYQSIHSVASSLKDRDIAKFQRRADERANQERHLYHLPRILSAQEDAYLTSASNQRARALQAFFEDIHTGRNAAVSHGIIGTDVLSKIMKKAGVSTDDLRRFPWETSGFYYGPDIIRNSDGKFHILEDNVGNLGGIADAVEARKDLLELLPQYRNALKDGKGEDFAATIAKTLRGMSRPADGALVFALPSSKIREYQLMISQLEAEGIYVVTEQGHDRDIIPRSNSLPLGYDHYRVEMHKGTPYLAFYDMENAEEMEERNPVIFKKIGAIATRGYNPKSFKKAFPNLSASVANSRVPCLGLGYPELNMLSDKELSIYVEKFVRFYLHEEPLISYIPTTSFSSDRAASHGSADVEHVFAHINDYVIKDSVGMQGSGVFIGSKLSPKQIRALKTSVESDPGRFVVQKRFHLSTVGGQIVDSRTYSTVTRYGVRTADYKWGRAVSQDGDGRVNLSQQGQVIAVFAEGRDTPTLSDKKSGCIRSFFAGLVGRAKKTVQ